MRTVVLGLLLALVAVVTVLGSSAEVTVDPVLVVVGALLGTGVLLLAGSAVTVARERRHEETGAGRR